MLVCKVVFSGAVKMACSRVEIQVGPSSSSDEAMKGVIQGLLDPKFYFYLLNNAVKGSSPKVARMLRVVQLNQGLYQLIFM